jgi:hypothetical protein
VRNGFEFKKAGRANRRFSNGPHGLTPLCGKDQSNVRNLNYIQIEIILTRSGLCTFVDLQKYFCGNPDSLSSE